jgi:hypothetical protein
MPAETQIALYRGLLAERTAECAALAEALDAGRHEFVADYPRDLLCGHRSDPPTRMACWKPAGDPVHRTSARVRAELGTAR